jgi:hypothetical protein
LLVLDQARKGAPASRWYRNPAQISNVQTGTSSAGDHLEAKHNIPKPSKEAGRQAVLGAAGFLQLSDEFKELLTNSLAQFVAEDLRPCSIVEGTGFRRMMKLAAPGYNVPCAETIASRIGGYHENMKTFVGKLLEEVPGYAITTDGWSSKASLHYIGSTLHYISKDWELCDVVLGVKAARGACSFDF